MPLDEGYDNNGTDMVKSILQNIIDDMNDMEADRIMPEDRKPKAMKVEVKTATPKPEMVEETMEDDELDPAVLDELMTKADQADENGLLPEDAEDELPPDIADSVRRKRQTDLPQE